MEQQPSQESVAAAATEQKPDDAQKKENTISNLPLLFANGYPTSLEKITEAQLNKFIPFMVQCSLGNVQPSTPPPTTDPESVAAEGETDTPVQSTTPPWWPEDIPFTLPLVQPETIAQTDWVRKLKELVCVCYEYHNNVFLLRFCTVLSKYEPECLRFINNYNSTTSLYDRFNNKLLVTFRNENMLYDKEYNPNRICLLPRRKTGAAGVSVSESPAEDEPEEGTSMVEPPLFDIYLCDYCDAELYSLEACREHERSCQETSERGADGEDDSDVILCEDEEILPTTIASAVKQRTRKKAAPGRDVKAKKRKQAYEEVELIDSLDDDEEYSNDGMDAGVDDKENQMRSFLSHFQLVSCKGTPADNWPKQRSPRKSGGARSPVKVPENKGKGGARRGRNDRSVLTVQRCATVPLASPMGKFLLRTQKTILTGDYMQERNDRMERFCVAPVIRDGIKPRWLMVHQAGSSETFPVTHRAIDYRGMFEKDEGYDPKYVHQYRFPRRQLSNRSKELSWMALTQVLLKSCIPCTVDLQRMTETDIKVYFLHLAIERKKRELMELRKADLMRMFVQQQRMLKRPPDECIDLCSSSDEAEEEEDDDDDDAVMVVEEVEGARTETVVRTRRPGPKRAVGGMMIKRQRLEDDEMKENRIAMEAGGQQEFLSKDSSRNSSFMSSHFQMRNHHSALQMNGGDVTKPLSVAVGTHITGAWATNTMAQGSPQTAAQMGVLLPNDPHPGHRNISSNLMGSASSLTSQSPITGQPSSYLFLTKQQLVYQQLEVTSTEADVVQGNEVEEVVACEVSVVTSTSTAEPPAASNSSMTERVNNSPLKANEAADGTSSILARQLMKEKDNSGKSQEEKQSSSTITTSTRIQARKSLPGRMAVTNPSPAEFTASQPSSSSSSSSSSSIASPPSAGPRLRRTSMCDAFAQKKMPSLIRIAPA